MPTLPLPHPRRSLTDRRAPNNDRPYRGLTSAAKVKSGSVVISVSSFKCHFSRVNRKIAQIVIHCGPFSHCLELLNGIEIEGDTSELQNARGHEGRVLEVASHGMCRLIESRLRCFGYFFQGLEPKFWWWDILVKRADVGVMMLARLTKQSSFFSRVYCQVESFREIGS